MEKVQRASARKLTTLPLIAAIFFMVSGGSYGLEELIQKAGYQLTLIILLAVPLLWSLPTALMLGELSAAIPAEGGFYVWVTRAMGPFWGFQEAWLSLAASVFDMAIYPTIFVLYLSRLWPWAGEHTMLVGGAVILATSVLNLRGARVVGDSSILFGALLLSPFLLMTVIGLLKPGAAFANGAHFGVTSDLIGGLVIAMWNFMGWDNATTVAGEVERPQRTYPIAMLTGVALVALDYLLPTFAVSRTGIDPSSWTTGSWVDAATAIGGRWLGLGVVCGGMLCGAGMFNALSMSYTRLPMVMAEDRFLPRVFARRMASTGAPWVAILVCAAAWTASLGLSFERLILIDVSLYGLSLVLEFIALAVLRVKEPGLPRPFKVPGGLLIACLLGVPSALLFSIAFLRNRSEQIGPISSMTLALALIALGPVLYVIQRPKTAKP